jgi:Inner membrane component of T3SS, cytoplasmic domain
MGAVMWIEVLSRHGEVAARERIEAPEARIGRAFDNDVVIDDVHVAPHHLRIYRGEDGELVAEDLGSLNGLFPEHGAKAVPTLSLAKEPGIRIGRTTLRVHDSAHPVAAERLLTPPRAHARWASSLGVLLLLALLALQWLNLTAEPSASQMLLPLLGFVTILVLWTSLWGMLSRVFFGQARFSLQLRIAITACIALLVWDQLTETLSFSFAWRDMMEYTGLGAWVLLAAACYAHLRAIGPRHMLAAMAIVIALLGAGAAVQYLGTNEVRKLQGQRATLGELRPPQFRLVPLASADAFFKKAEGARISVDRARVKEPATAGLLSDLDNAD